LNGENIIQTITTIYPSLTRSEKKIADFVLHNAIDAQYMSITSLAEECGVADATISRFCKTLGYQSYNEFKLALAKNGSPADQSVDASAYDKITSDDSVMDMAKKLYATDMLAVKQSLEMIDPDAIKKAVEYFHAANRVYCFGQGGSGVIAKEAWARFVTATPQFQCIEDGHMQVIATSLCSPTDVIFFFSYSGATKDVCETLATAKKRDTRVVLVTHFPKCPAAAYADVILLCGSQESPLNSGSVAAKMGQLFIIDVLFHEYCRMDLFHTNQNRETTSNALSGKLI